MSRKSVVIIGAGVAGLSSAWWINQLGWSVTIVERATDLRNSGYMLGLSGPGYDAVDKMGMIDVLKQYEHKVDDSIYFDKQGKKLFSLNIKKVWGDIDMLMLSRTDLVNELYRKLHGLAGVTVLFDTEVMSFQENNSVVSMALSNQQTITADLVLAADGVHSASRRKLFDNETQCKEYLGYKVAAFAMDDPARLTNEFESFAEPNRVVELYPLKDNRSAGLFMWKDADYLRVVSSAEAKRQLLRQFENSHEKVKHKIAAHGDDQPLFFDSLLMIDLPQWSKGRILLLGDSAHCLTLLSGQGAGIAMTSSYVLAQLLKRFDIDEALEKHEIKLRPVVERLQARSRKLAPWFIPSTQRSFRIRNLIIKALPNRIIGWYFLRSVKSNIVAAKVEGI